MQVCCVMKDATSAYYIQNAELFYQSTISIDAQPLYDSFLPLIPAGSRILDAGCGSGRDAKAFKDKGYAVEAFDACEPLAGMAATFIEQPVAVSTFLNFTSQNAFDGIWACASLLHVPQSELLLTMQHLSALLAADGVFYCSFKYGLGEVMRNERHFTYMNEAQLCMLAEQAQLDVQKLWITQDLREDRAADSWINAILKKHG